MRRVMTAFMMALLVAVSACGKGDANTGTTTSTDLTKRKAYAQCMRDNGVVNFPDPNPQGEFPAGHEQNTRDDPKFKDADSKCRDLLPAGDKHDTVNPETIAGLVKFAQCMRQNGVPDFPDPDASGKFPRDAEERAHNDPKFQAASETCRKDLPQHGGS